MHELAENGIASHWLYAESGKPKKGSRAEGKKFEWIKQLRRWQKEVNESSEFLEGLKIDIFSNRIFVFTPNGDVIDLPEGATPVDFAYLIHTQLGDNCSAAKVNGDIVSLDTELKNGDLIQIIREGNRTPSRDWLRFVKTSTARSRIRAHLKKARRDENIEHGRQLLNAELEKLNQPNWISVKKTRKDNVLLNLPYKDELSLIAAVGQGDISPYRVVKYVVDEKQILAQKAITGLAFSSKMRKKTDKIHKIKLGELEGAATRIAHCCSPIPGEDIGAYITIRAYAAIHRLSCSNFMRLAQKNKSRIIPASWQANKDMHFAQIKIAAFDRVGLLQEVSSTISNMGINILSIKAEQQADAQNADLSVIMEVFDIDQLHMLINHLERIKNVKNVQRV